MLIIIEGPDGAGKSTLVEALSATIDAQTFHRGPPQSHPLDEYEKPLISYRPSVSEHIICDRWHYGEWVYPEIMGRKSLADSAIWWHIELFLAARGALIVTLLPDVDTLRRRLGIRGDDYVHVDQLEAIHDSYVHILGDTIASTFVPTTNDVELIVKAVLRDAEHVTQRAAEVRHNGSYVGPPNPSRLFIGERTSFSSPYPPAFGPYPTTSGHWMLDAWQGIVSPKIGFANTHEEDLHDLWESLDHPPTVSLGAVAHNALDAARVPHGAIPHPQYVRRFHHYHKRWYAELAIKASHSQEDYRRWRP